MSNIPALADKLTNLLGLAAAPVGVTFDAVDVDRSATVASQPAG